MHSIAIGGSGLVEQSGSQHVKLQDDLDSNLTLMLNLSALSFFDHTVLQISILTYQWKCSDDFIQLVILISITSQEKKSFVSILYSLLL